MRGFSDVVICLSVRRCWMFTVHVARHLDAIETCFGVHLQVVFIAWLLALWAIVSFLSTQGVS